MFKIIFVLVINAYHGGMTTIDFTTLQQCETAREKVQAAAARGARIGAVCIEKQVPLKKTKCKIINDFSYRNTTYETLTGYPYPVALECVEEQK
jgi:hypothetical protein